MEAAGQWAGVRGRDFKFQMLIAPFCPIFGVQPGDVELRRSWLGYARRSSVGCCPGAPLLGPYIQQVHWAPCLVQTALRAGALGVPEQCVDPACLR